MKGTTGGSLNSVVIDVLGAAGGRDSDKDNTGPLQSGPGHDPHPAAVDSRGSVVHRTAGQDGIPPPHFLYTVPNADFNGVVTFQYTIRDGVNAVEP